MDARASGIIVNTTGWGDAASYYVLLQCIRAFSADVVLVMGHDKLNSKFSSDVGEHVTVVKLPKSGGVVERVSAVCLYDVRLRLCSDLTVDVTI